MVRLADKRPGRYIAIVYTGLRSGEKLHETLLHADERYRPTAHPTTLKAEAREVVVDRINGVCVRLRDAVARYDPDELATMLHAPVTELFSADSPQLPRLAGTVEAFPAVAETT